MEISLGCPPLECMIVRNAGFIGILYEKNKNSSGDYYWEGEQPKGYDNQKKFWVSDCVFFLESLESLERAEVP